MPRRLISVALLMCLVVLVANACSDSNSNTGPVSNDDIANEAPMTQEDISTYIRLIPELAPVEKNGKEAAVVYKKHGISRLRYHYLRTKITLCAGLNAGARHNLDMLPQSLRPSEYELNLVSDNWADIDAAEKAYKQNMI